MKKVVGIIFGLFLIVGAASANADFNIRGGGGHGGGGGNGGGGNSGGNCYFRCNELCSSPHHAYRPCMDDCLSYCPRYQTGNVDDFLN